MLVFIGDSEAKETIGDGGGRKYDNSQFSNQNRQDAISRVSAVQNSARGSDVRALTVWRLKHTVTSTVQTASEWQPVTAAHHSIWRHLYDSMHAAQKPKGKLDVITLDNESNMSTLWRRAEFLRIFSSTKASSVRSTLLLRSGNLSRLTLWWVSADR